MPRSLVALCLLGAASVPGRANGQSDGVVYRANWADIALVTVSGAAALLPSLFELPHGAPSCAPCNSAGLSGVDRWAVGQHSSLAQTGSNLMLVGIGGVSTYLTLHDRSPAQARGNLAVLANSISWTAASTQWLKVLVRRKRPVLYTSGAVAAAGDPDNQRSFPSNHTSFAFAIATSYLVMGQREHLPHHTRNALLLLAGATGIGVLRVVSGNHFPTDVLGGAALGSGVGWLVATLHPRVP